MTEYTKRSWHCLIITFIVLICSTGCFSYSEPSIALEAAATLVSADESTMTVTYDISSLIKNTGSNNAYDVRILVLISTSPDQPEYRMNSATIDVGTLLKGETTTKALTLPLEVTRLHFDKLASGEEKPHVEVKVSRISSNIMG
ncbi:MAG: hypothetical protein JXA44_09055 [Methanospirillaceae archaeon]|nr:hypothetical protein [Methanospirillaceae archaeon]